ncbi:hypothetical protein D8676_18360 [Mesorhizobium sp. YM1C-6-2]|nr:hypothetical protein D8676_18360 [Mesorhizobium sp. YM1C-6-2]
MSDGRRVVTATQHRGAVDRGLAEDKTPGFDPAAAPMETDAEAGSATDHSEMSVARDAPGPLPRVNAASHGNAMRPIDDQKERSSSTPFLPLILGVVLVILIIATVELVS